MQASAENYLADCNEARSALDGLIERRQGDVSREVSHAVHCLVRARDHLIDERRNGELSGQAQQALIQINALLSLMASVEFPLAGVHWPRLEQARDELNTIADSSTDPALGAPNPGRP